MVDGWAFFPSIHPLNVKVKVSPVEGDDVSQQQAPLVVGEFAVEEKVLAAQKVWGRTNEEEKKLSQRKIQQCLFCERVRREARSQRTLCVCVRGGVSSV